jgi:cell division protein FtsQ
MRPNYGRIALRCSLLLLGAVSLSALFFSPRFWVRRVQIEGLQTVPAARIVARLGLKPRTNLILLPTARLQQAAQGEPAVARARVRRVFPGGVLVLVEERQPVAVVQAGSAFYTIDRTRVAFRKDDFAPPGLPLIALKPTGDAAEQNDQVSLAALGKRMTAPGLAEASNCLTWVHGQANKFPLERIVVDPSGGLCLNRKGGMEVRLGTGADLDKKLDVLDVLLARRPDVQAGDVAYVNLFAYDVPAILTRQAALNAPDAAPRNEP